MSMQLSIFEVKGFHASAATVPGLVELQLRVVFSQRSVLIRALFGPTISQPSLCFMKNRRILSKRFG